MQNNNPLLTIITSNSSNGQYWDELLRFKELFLLLAWRDFLVRYKQTFIGVIWAVLRPLATVIVFTFVFGKVANLPSSNIPYALFVFSAMLPWQFFSSTLTDAGNSLVANSGIVSKVYFPRLLLPLSSMAVCMIDALIATLLFACLMIWYGETISLKILLLPFFLLWLLMISSGVSIWISALNVTYRDFRYLIPFLVQLGTYISPVGFSSEIIPSKWQWLFYLNPLVGIIDGFRWCFFNNAPNYPILLAIPSFVASIIIFYLSIKYFRKKEDSFADGL